MDYWEEDHDTAPYADPAIRPAYEAALGRLILAHNEVDFRLAKALERAVLRIAPDRTLIHYATGTFDNRVRNLELLQRLAPGSGIVGVDVAELRRLNAIRNTVAHGHFDQNPFDGSFVLVGDGKGRDKKKKEFATSELDEAAAALKAIATSLFAHEVFGDRPLNSVPPEGARPLP